MMIRLAAALAVLATAACMPMVQHGPWVREGTSGGLLVAGARTNDIASEDIPSTLIGFDGGIRHGYVPSDSSRPAFAVGAQTSLWALLLLGSTESAGAALSFMSVDAYMSAPLLSRLGTAVGLTASMEHMLPYIQIGTKSPVNGWYSTQAFLLIPDEDLFMWLPSFTKSEQDRRARATHFTIGGGIGSKNSRTYYLFMIGAYMEFFRKDARAR